MFNRVVILNFKNHRFATDPGWGESLQRIHLGRTKKEDVEKINTRVFGPNLSLPSLEELNGADTTYACAINADRNLICDNIFANILKQRHPKEDQDFMVPQETIIIKGNFLNMKTDESKSAAYHKMIQSKCGDDNVQCGKKQSIIRVDPYLNFLRDAQLWSVPMTTRIWEQSRVQRLNSWALNLKKKKPQKWKYGMGTRFTQWKPMMLSFFSVNTPKKSTTTLQIGFMLFCPE